MENAVAIKSWMTATENPKKKLSIQTLVWPQI